MNVLDLFSGLGGFALGLESVGMRTVAFCERDPFARGVLRHHWPDVPVYPDVAGITAGRLRADGIAAPDLVCGGFPCQPFSVAGEQRGEDDERHLWPEFARIVAELRPRWVVAENVPGIRTIAADGVCADLEALGYAVWPCVVGADNAGAPHIRKRVWFVAYGDRFRCDGRAPPAGWQARAGAGTQCSGADAADADRARLAQRIAGDAGRARPDGRADAVGIDWWDAEPDLGRVADGVPHRVDRLRCLGNAVVPAVVAAIGAAILHVEREIAHVHAA